MSSSSNIPSWVQPVSAAIAIFPACSDLHAKTKQQLNGPTPTTFNETFKEVFRQLREPVPMTLSKRLIGGLTLSPTVGGIIGAQMILQKKVEKHVPSKLGSSAIVGFFSSPALAVFNGLSADQGFWKPLKGIFTIPGLKQVAAITAQETAFVAGMSAADPVCEWAKQTIGDNPVVEYSTAAASGGVGGAAGHVFNTAITRWQAKDKPVTLDANLLNGLARRTRAIAGFAALYKFLKNQFTPETK